MIAFMGLARVGDSLANFFAPVQGPKGNEFIKSAYFGCKVFVMD